MLVIRRMHCTLQLGNVQTGCPSRLVTIFVVGSQTFMGTPMAVKVGAQRTAVRGMPVVKATAVKTITRKPVPVELEKIELPMNTFTNKNTFKAKIKSVERIVGPKATGETCHIIIETNGKIPFWEGQSYGVIPPVILKVFPNGTSTIFLHQRGPL